MAGDAESEFKAKAKREVELAAKAKDGDTDAMNELLLQYEGAIYRLAWKLCRGKAGHELEDIVQETMVILLRRKTRAFDPSKATFSTWFHWQIYGAMQRALNPTQSKRKLRILEAMLFSEFKEKTRNKVYNRLAAPIEQPPPEVSKQLLEDLTEQQRVVITKICEGYLLKEIAPLLGVCASRVQQIKASAFEKIRGKYGDYDAAVDANNDG